MRDQSAPRAKVIAELKRLLDFEKEPSQPERFIRESEDFDGRPNAIWFTNESFEYFGHYYYPYGTVDYPGVAEPLQVLLDRLGWWLEPYDSETLFLYQNRNPIEDNTRGY